MALDKNIKCLHCGETFELNQALSAELETKVKNQIQDRLSAQQREFSAKLNTYEVEKAQTLRAAEQARIEALQVLEKERTQALKQAATERNQLLQAAAREKETLTLQIQQRFSLEQIDLKNQLEEERKFSAAAQEKELELRKMQRELEARSKSQELDFQRRIDEQTSRIVEEAQRQAQEQSSMVIETQKLKMAELQKSLEDAQRKALQGSQQTQGEAFELRLEEEFSRLFPLDQFEPVPKGVRGADLIHRVYTANGKLAGTILWEFKQTKTWSDDWVTKLKEDQRELSAEMAAIISVTPPRGIPQLGEMEHVWVAQPLLAKALACLLREQILKVHQARAASLIPADQKESVFTYLTGTKFKHCIEGEIEIVSSLLADLQKEKRSFVKIWASREQQLNQLLTFKAGLYGDLQGILGKSLPNIQQLELPNPSESEYGGRS